MRTLRAAAILASPPAVSVTRAMSGCTEIVVPSLTHAFQVNDELAYLASRYDASPFEPLNARR